MYSEISELALEKYKFDGRYGTFKRIKRQGSTKNFINLLDTPIIDEVTENNLNTSNEALSKSASLPSKMSAPDYTTFLEVPLRPHRERRTSTGSVLSDRSSCSTLVASTSMDCLDQEIDYKKLKKRGSEGGSEDGDSRTFFGRKMSNEESSTKKMSNVFKKSMSKIARSKSLDRGRGKLFKKVCHRR